MTLSVLIKWLYTDNFISQISVRVSRNDEKNHRKKREISANIDAINVVIIILALHEKVLIDLDQKSIIKCLYILFLNITSCQVY